MIIKTDSGNVTLNKKSHYAKWLQGWIDGGGFSGAFTLEKAWSHALLLGKPSGCSWYAYGLIMAREQKQGRALAVEE